MLNNDEIVDETTIGKPHFSELWYYAARARDWHALATIVAATGERNSKSIRACVEAWNAMIARGTST